MAQVSLRAILLMVTGLAMTFATGSCHLQSERRQWELETNLAQRFKTNGSHVVMKSKGSALCRVLAPNYSMRITEIYLHESDNLQVDRQLIAGLSACGDIHCVIVNFESSLITPKRAEFVFKIEKMEEALPKLPLDTRSH